LIDLFSDLCTRQDNLAADEDQENNLWLHHAIDETWEQLWLVRAKVVMLASQTLQSDGEFDIARPNDVLNLEVGKLGVETKLLDNASVFTACKFAVVFGFGACDNHLARSKDQSSCLWITDTHDDGRESLWIVLGISSVQRNGLEIKSAVEIYGGDQVSY